VRADTPDDVWLYNNAGVEYAEIDDHESALTWLTQGLRLAMATGDPEGLVEQLADLREESLSELGRREDQLQRDAEEFLDNPPPPRSSHSNENRCNETRAAEQARRAHHRPATDAEHPFAAQREEL
jgi:hypothetical protein